jgi:hypothetical protein
MILIIKTKHKCLRIVKLSHAQKSHKMTQKRHKKQSSQEKEIYATMNAFIQTEVRFSTNS